MSFWLTNCYAQEGAEVCDGARETAVSRDGTRIAVVSTNADAVRYRLVLYSSQGPPPRGNEDPASGGTSEPSPRCLFSSPAGEFGKPDFAPAGDGLTWQDGDGIHVIRGADVGALCAQSSPAPVVPGGSDPSWGPAHVAPNAGGTTTGGDGAPALSSITLTPARLARGRAATHRPALHGLAPPRDHRTHRRRRSRAACASGRASRAGG